MMILDSGLLFWATLYVTCYTCPACFIPPFIAVCSCIACIAVCSYCTSTVSQWI